jgi:hypothetical protein
MTAASLVENNSVERATSEESLAAAAIEPVEAHSTNGFAPATAFTAAEPWSQAEVPVLVSGAEPTEVTLDEVHGEKAVEVLPPAPIHDRGGDEEKPIDKAEVIVSAGVPIMAEVSELHTPPYPPEVPDLHKSLEGSGLVMVETSAAQVQSWEAPSNLEEPATPRRRRTPPPQAQKDEPLVQVETGK